MNLPSSPRVFTAAERKHRGMTYVYETHINKSHNLRAIPHTTTSRMAPSMYARMRSGAGRWVKWYTDSVRRGLCNMMIHELI